MLGRRQSIPGRSTSVNSRTSRPSSGFSVAGFPGKPAPAAGEGGSSGLRPEGASSGWGDGEAALPRRCEGEARPDVLGAEAREVCEDLGFRHPAGEVLQDVIDRDAGPRDARLPAPDAGSHGDEVFPSHGPKDIRWRPLVTRACCASPGLACSSQMRWTRWSQCWKDFRSFQLRLRA